MAEAGSSCFVSAARMDAMAVVAVVGVGGPRDSVRSPDEQRDQRDITKRVVWMDEDGCGWTWVDVGECAARMILLKTCIT